MNAGIIRIRKEARALFWPWCAVLVAGTLPAVVPHSYAEPASWISFTMAIPLLASLSLGSEFHHRTLSLWLAQPCSRMQLWGEKMSVMFAAVLSAALVSGIGMFYFTWPRQDFALKVAATAYVVITMASAPFCALTARSALGGVALNYCLQFCWIYLPSWIVFGRQPWEVVTLSLSAETIAAMFVFGSGYAGLMLWLGARKLSRFQVTGGAGDDLVMAGPSVMPQAVAGWFRCRPSGTLLNLIRKELRLLRPLWLMELLVVLYVACLATFRLLPTPAVPLPRKVLEWALLGPLVSLCIGMAGLAGTLSVGEERNSGTQAWHMTLPVSAHRQWLVKLVMAMLAGPACAVLLPVLTMMAGGSVFGSPLMYVDLRSLPDQLGVFAVLTFACFWCACAANGTVHAAIWLVPVTIVNYLAAASGLWLGQELAQTTGTVKDLVVSQFHLNPFLFPMTLSSPSPGFIVGPLSLAFVAPILFGVYQSGQLFRKLPSDNLRRMLRCLLPLAAVSFFWCLAVSAGLGCSRWRPLDETRQALDRLRPGTAKLELASEDLARNYPLTGPTQRWLKGARITVTPDHSHSSDYLATIHLAGSVECRLTAVHAGGTAASCAHERP